MKKTRTGFMINYSGTLWVRGDEYKCPRCSRIVYGDFGKPFESRAGNEGEIVERKT
jgi:hypothetical protein